MMAKRILFAAVVALTQQGIAQADNWMPWVQGTALGTCYVDTESISRDRHGVVSANSTCEGSSSCEGSGGICESTVLDIIEVACYRREMRTRTAIPARNITDTVPWMNRRGASPWSAASPDVMRILCGR
jgi:hypothetical protein